MLTFTRKFAQKKEEEQRRHFNLIKYKTEDAKIIIVTHAIIVEAYPDYPILDLNAGVFRCIKPST